VRLTKFQSPSPPRSEEDGVLTTRRTMLGTFGAAGVLAVLGTGAGGLFKPSKAFADVIGPAGIDLTTLPSPSSLPVRPAPYAAMPPGLAQQLQALKAASPDVCTICYYQESGKCDVEHCPLHGCCYLIVPTGCSGSNDPVLECLAISCQGNFCEQ
jgi:hypothetical protein